MKDVRPLASRQDVATFLGVPVGTLDQWAHRGLGPRYRKIGRHAKYAWSDVLAWVEQQASGGGRVA